MAEASTTELTVTLKQLGKHLRSVRRGKGLSLSEVARGAGLSRRELVAYERGKVPIPENDLWVLAGSCGVDVGELLPSATSKELVLSTQPATSIGDSVAQLRKHHEDPGITPYLGTLHKLQALPVGKRIPVKDRELSAIAAALGGTPDRIDQKLQEVLRVSPDEAHRLREMIVAPGGRGSPKAIAAATAPAVMFTPVTAPEPEAGTDRDPRRSRNPSRPLPVAPAAFLDAPLDAAVGHNVDVFEELARLPEPLPLGDPSAPVPDFLAPPADTFADDPFALAPLVGATFNGPPEGAVELVDADPGALPVATAFGLATDAPPIDVAMRQGSDRWDLGTAPGTETRSPPPTRRAGTRPAGSRRPRSGAGDDDTTPTGFWEGTDDWAPVDAPEAHDPPGPDDGLFADDAPVEVLAAEIAPIRRRLGPRPVDGDTRARIRRRRPVERRRVATRARGRRRPVGPRALRRSGGHRFLRRLGHPRDRVPHRRPGDDGRPRGVGHHAHLGAHAGLGVLETTQAWDAAPVTDAPPEWAAYETQPVGAVEVLDDDFERDAEEQAEQHTFEPAAALAESAGAADASPAAASTCARSPSPSTSS